MSSRPSTSRLMISRSDNGAHRVSFVELFFDLVFVFAITQIAHGLIAHPDGVTFVRTIVLTLAMWWMWVYMTWAMNWLNPDHRVAKVMLIAVMLVVLLMSSAIPEAFDEGGGLVFAVGYVGVQVGRTAFMALVARGRDRALMLNFTRITIWFGVSGVLWIMGALLSPEERLYFWAAAIAVEVLVPTFRFKLPILGSTPVDAWTITGEYMAERTGLFIILVLGESIIVTGTAFGELDPSALQVSAFISAFASTVLMWLLYFAHDESRGRRFITTAARSGLVARSAYTYAPVVLVLGLVLTAVADELVLLHPVENLGNEDQTVPTTTLIWVATSVYLVGNLVFKRAIGRPWLWSHISGVVLLAVVWATPLGALPLVFNWASNAVLLGVIVWDYLTRRYERSREVSAATE